MNDIQDFILDIFSKNNFEIDDKFLEKLFSNQIFNDELNIFFADLQEILSKSNFVVAAYGISVLKDYLVNNIDFFLKYSFITRKFRDPESKIYIDARLAKEILENKYFLKKMDEFLKSEDHKMFFDENPEFFIRLMAYMKDERLHCQ